MNREQVEHIPLVALMLLEFQKYLVILLKKHFGSNLLWYLDGAVYIYTLTKLFKLLFKELLKLQMVATDLWKLKVCVRNFGNDLISRPFKICFLIHK